MHSKTLKELSQHTKSKIEVKICPKVILGDMLSNIEKMCSRAKCMQTRAENFNLVLFRESSKLLRSSASVNVLFSLSSLSTPSPLSANTNFPFTLFSE